METFTEEMFNRIFEFQEKKLAAWDETKPFNQRIKNLPLHNLVFSNADRDPEKFGPTVCPFYPLKREVVKLALYIKSVADSPLVCDLHAGNGFFPSLMAQTHMDTGNEELEEKLAVNPIRVIGMRDPSIKPNQITNFFDPDCYEPRTGTLSDIEFSYDVALSAWMPSNRNLTPQILLQKPAMIVFVYTDHSDDTGKIRQTGTSQAFEQPAGYHPVDSWQVERPGNLFHEIWPDLTPNIPETRQVAVYARDGLDIPVLDIPEITGYDWEKDLFMAQLAMEAKNMLRERGFPV